MTTWTKEERYAGTASITYDEATATYDDIRYSYDGKLITVWTNELIS